MHHSPTSTPHLRSNIVSLAVCVSAINQMHSENKLTNHGKQVTRGAQSQIASVNQLGCQESAANQGSKSTRSGSHEVKTNQISSSNPDLKSVGQSGIAPGVGRMMKTKAKRERTMSLDVADQKDTLASVLETETKGICGYLSTTIYIYLIYHTIYTQICPNIHRICKEVRSLTICVCRTLSLISSTI